MTGFLGPNGAGKTTTMRMMTGLVPATAGSATVDGRPVRRAAQPGRRRRHPARRLRRAPGPDRADAPAAAGRRVRRPGRAGGRGAGAGRARRRRPAPVGGYRSACGSGSGIAGALLADPPVLVFDEPANGLDPEGIRWMRDLLRARGAGRHGAAVEPPPGRGRAHGRPAAGDRGRRIVADGRSPSCSATRARPCGPSSGRPDPRPRGRRVPRATRHGRRPGRARDRSGHRSAPSPPPGATRSWSSGRSSAISRTSSSSSPPRHDRWRPSP